MLGQALDDLRRIRALEDLQAGQVSEATPPGFEGEDPLQTRINALQAQLSQQTPPGSDYGATGTGSALTPQQRAAINAEIADLQAQLANQASRPTSQQRTQANYGGQIAAIRARLPAGANEASLQTELALTQSRLARNQKRYDLSQEVKQLVAKGVPSLGRPIAA